MVFHVVNFLFLHCLFPKISFFAPISVNLCFIFHVENIHIVLSAGATVADRVAAAWAVAVAGRGMLIEVWWLLPAPWSRFSVVGYLRRQATKSAVVGHALRPWLGLWREVPRGGGGLAA